MKLENQVCTIEQARRLKELGVAQESEFIFFVDAQHLFRNNRSYIPSENDYCAYTVAELGVMLPYNQVLTGWNFADKFICGYYERESKGSGKHKYSTVGETEAEARAAMLIFLIENNITTVLEVNTRLSAQ